MAALESWPELHNEVQRENFSPKSQLYKTNPNQTSTPNTSRPLLWRSSKRRENLIASAKSSCCRCRRRRTQFLPQLTSQSELASGFCRANSRTKIDLLLPDRLCGNWEKRPELWEQRICCANSTRGDILVARFNLIPLVVVPPRAQSFAESMEKGER